MCLVKAWISSLRVKLKFVWASGQFKINAPILLSQPCLLMVIITRIFCFFKIYKNLCSNKIIKFFFFPIIYFCQFFNYIKINNFNFLLFRIFFKVSVATPKSRTLTLWYVSIKFRIVLKIMLKYMPEINPCFVILNKFFLL